MNKINYLYSILLHLIILFFFIYVIGHKNKKMYNQIISLNVKAITPIKRNELDEKKLTPIETKKKTEEKEFESKFKKNKSSSNIQKKINNNVIKNNNVKSLDEKNKQEELLIGLKENRKKILNKYFKKEKTLKDYNSDSSKNNKILNTKLDKSKLSSKENAIFNKYSFELKEIIQTKATQNYPRASLRRREEGDVQLTFSIETNGDITNIKIGNKTRASDRLVKASLKTLALISPYKPNSILKKKNTFSIIIVYKLR